MIVQWLLAATLLSAVPENGPRTLSLDECRQMALSRNPDVLMSSDEVSAAKADRASAAGLFGPRAHLDAGINEWSDAYEIPFAAPPAPPFIARKQETRSLTATVVQPITPLLALYENFHLQNLGVDIAKIRQQAMRRDTTYQVTEAYFRLLQASSLLEVANKSVEQVTAQVDRASKLEKQGAIAKNDVLRAQIALAGAKQRLLQARGGAELAAGRLAILIGLPADTAIKPTTVPDRPAVASGLSAEESEARALKGRVELRELDDKISQARAGSRAEWARLAPQVAIVGSYLFSDVSALQQKNSRFIGAALSWDVWDWGATWNQGRSASFHARQAERARAKVRDGIALETRAAWVTFNSTDEAVRVAEAAVAQAEENFRIETKRYEAAAITTFDVLDAESLLTQARSLYQTSLFDSHIAAANLERAMGGTPGATDGKAGAK